MNTLELQTIDTVHKTMADANAFDLAAQKAEGEQKEEMQIQRDQKLELAKSLILMLDQVAEGLTDDAKAGLDNIKQHYNVKIQYQQERNDNTDPSTAAQGEDSSPDTVTLKGGQTAIAFIKGSIPCWRVSGYRFL